MAKDSAPSSLVNPDLKGLWSSSLLKDKGLLAWMQGALVLLCLSASWVLGMWIPMWVVWILYRGGTADWERVVGTVLAVVLAWPYVVTVKRWPRASRFWLSAANYFEGGCSMSWEEKRDPDDISTPQMHCYHPHGIFTLGLIMNSGIRSSAAEHSLGTELWAKYVGRCGRVPFVGLAAEQLVQMPVFKHIMVLWTGNIESASKGHMLAKMKRKECFGLCPGGFHELALFEKGKDRVYLKKTGFIYYALKYGYWVVPAYTFGECDTYFNVRGARKLRERLADYGLPAIFITGPLRWVPLLALVPFGSGVGLHTIHGKGRQFPQVDQPTKEQVDEYHKWYCGAICDLFERNKGRFGITESLDVIE